MKMLSTQLCFLVVLYICKDSLAGNLKVKYGQVTFDSEGNDDPNSRYFSRKPHVPSSSSGLTLGRGYDLKERSSSSVYRDLTRSGLKASDARKFLGAVGLKGKQAKDFIEKNKLQGFTITPEQQESLFYIAYDEIERDAKRLATKADVQKAYGATDWNGLNRKIKDIVVDLRYRGDYTPTTRRKIQRAVAANDLKKFTQLMSDKHYWVTTIRVPTDRFQRRIKALE